MPDAWILRVCEELRELRDRIEKLALFLTSNDAILVGDTQRMLLELQLGVMRTYADILHFQLQDAKGK